ncbi:hypothetical protein [Microbacterium gilvum]|uniref:Uncharacterized protein n=1 Tax=Microbacterium gilvum TaxID=1336204 RepID=A0ABP8ZT98_9MICO
MSAVSPHPPARRADDGGCTLERATLHDLPLLVRMSVRLRLRGMSGTGLRWLLAALALLAAGSAVAGAFVHGVAVTAIVALFAVGHLLVVAGAVLAILAAGVLRRLRDPRRDIVLSPERDAAVDVVRGDDGVLEFSHHVALGRGRGRGRALRRLLAAELVPGTVDARMTVPDVGFAALVLEQFPSLELHEAGGALVLCTPGVAPLPLGRR